MADILLSQLYVVMVRDRRIDIAGPFKDNQVATGWGDLWLRSATGRADRPDANGSPHAARQRAPSRAAGPRRRVEARTSFAEHSPLCAHR